MVCSISPTYGASTYFEPHSGDFVVELVWRARRRYFIEHAFQGPKTALGKADNQTPG